ncbi:NADase-type glycan-binding domain-containing protein [Streptomyces sp. MS2.AVA.5]|uniref:Zinc ribbon domain-containing protein n=1 Tax=Streptomyces achmelvichensis TaxID=3134111 RepID=A0ACC6Q4G8_9ACTN
MTSQTSGTGPGREAVPNCAECGTRAEPGQSFCDSCGAVLGWTASLSASSSASAAPMAAAAPTAATPDRTRSAEGGAAAHASDRGPATRTSAPGGPGATAGTADSERGPDARAHAQADGTGPAATDPVPADPHEPRTDSPHDGGGRTTARRTDTDPTADTAPTRPVPSAAPDPAPPATHDPAPAPDAASDRARSLLVPVADPDHRAPAEPAVAPVLPGRPVAARPQVRAPEPDHATTGGVRCPWCSTANRPDRHFCGRCAMPMAERPHTPGHLPWWRRLFASRNGETPWAGDRPRLRRGFGRVLNWVVAALVLALLITAVVNADDGVRATRDHFAKRAPVAPDRVTASRSYPGHGPQLLVDKLNNTWWGPGVTQSGKGEWVEARFDRPTRLLDLVITSGVSARPDQLSSSALPHRVEARITTADGSTTTRYLTLDQSAGGQRRPFRVGEVTAVRFTLESAHGASGTKQISLAEIEFFGPSSSGVS